MLSIIALRSAITEFIGNTFQVATHENYSPIKPEGKTLLQVRVEADKLERMDRLKFDRRVTLSFAVTWPESGADVDLMIDARMELASSIRSALLVTTYGGYKCESAEIVEPIFNQAAHDDGSFLLIGIKAVFRNAAETFDKSAIPPMATPQTVHLTLPAEENIESLSVVYSSGIGVRMASADNVDCADIIVGIALNSAKAGENVRIVTVGVVESEEWGFQPINTPLFLGINGKVNFMPPVGDSISTGLVKKIGIALSEHSLLIQMERAVI